MLKFSDSAPNSKQTTDSNQDLKALNLTQNLQDSSLNNDFKDLNLSQDLNLTQNLQALNSNQDLKEKDLNKALKELSLKELENLLKTLPTPPTQGWERVRLGEVCKINEKTYNPSNDTNKEYIYIDIDSVGKGTGKFSIENKQMGSNLPSRARRIADNDSVIISTVRPYLKGFAYIKENMPNFIFSTGFAILKGGNKLNSKLLYILFMFSDDLMRQMENKMPKASYPSINADDIKAFKIPLPPLKEQEKIVQCIEFIESKIKVLNSKLQTLETKKAQILSQALGL